MLIDLNFDINFGDIVIDSRCKHYLVIRNTFNDYFSVVVIDLATSRIYDEYRSISDMKLDMNIIGVIKKNEIVIRRERHD